MSVSRFLMIGCSGVFLMACGSSGGSKASSDTGTTGGGTTEGGTIEGGTTEGGTGVDECKNDADLTILGSPHFFKQVEDCGNNCIGGSPNCVGDCVKELTGVTAGCSGCFDSLFGCILSDCLNDCAAGASSPACSTCWEAACGADFETCAGVPASGGGTTDGTTTDGTTTDGTTTDGTTTDGTTDGTTTDGCTPNCQGKNCGDDGCGGSCGDCPSGGFECDASFKCTHPQGCQEVSYEGCCMSDVVLFCDNNTLFAIDCTSNQDPAAAQCGWQAAESYFDCGGNPAGDPSNANPLVCPAPFGEGGGTTEGGTTGEPESFCDSYTATCDGVMTCGANGAESCAMMNCATWWAAAVVGTEADMAGATQGCYTYHLGVAGTDAAAADTHCPHAAGDAVCVDTEPPATFCDTYAATCGGVMTCGANGGESCAMMNCATWWAAAVVGTEADMAGATQGCYTYHLGMAGTDAAAADTHCPHAAGDAVCVDE